MGAVISIMLLANFFKKPAAAAVAPTPKQPTQKQPPSSSTKPAADGAATKASAAAPPQRELASPSVFSPPTNPARARTDEEPPAAAAPAPAAPAAAQSGEEKPGEKRKAPGDKPKKARGPGAALAKGHMPSGVLSVARAAAPAPAAKKAVAATKAKKAQLPSKAAPPSPAPTAKSESPFIAMQKTIIEGLLEQKKKAVEAEDFDEAENLKQKIAQARQTLEGAQLAQLPPAAAAPAPKDSAAAAQSAKAEESLEADVVKATDTGLSVELDEVRLRCLSLRQSRRRTLRVYIKRVKRASSWSSVCAKLVCVAGAALLLSIYAGRLEDHVQNSTPGEGEGECQGQTAASDCRSERGDRSRSYRIHGEMRTDSPEQADA